MENNLTYKRLVDKALKLRQDTFNAFIKHGEAHLGGSFSMIEMLLALHEEVLTPEDKFILSKAHSSFPYCIYLRENGFNPRLTTHLEIDPENNIHPPGTLDPNAFFKASEFYEGANRQQRKNITMLQNLQVQILNLVGH